MFPAGVAASLLASWTSETLSHDDKQKLHEICNKGERTGLRDKQKKEYITRGPDWTVAMWHDIINSGWACVGMLTHTPLPARVMHDRRSLSSSFTASPTLTPIACSKLTFLSPISIRFPELRPDGLRSHVSPIRIICNNFLLFRCAHSSLVAKSHTCHHQCTCTAKGYMHDFWRAERDHD